VDCTKVIFNYLHYSIRIKCLYKDPVYKEFSFPDYLIRVFKKNRVLNRAVKRLNRIDKVDEINKIGEVDKVDKVNNPIINFTYFRV